MTEPLDTISKKISLLNDTILESMAETSDKEIVKNFTEAGIKILDADFGFAWWKFSNKEDYKLAYKSRTAPYEPFMPREDGGHSKALRTKKPHFDEHVKKENYIGVDISPYMKSFVIIPICHANNLYGGLTICYKKEHKFTEDQLTLASSVGNSTAQAIAIHRLVQTDILLAQEKLKTEFIANATHELRTPLAIMKGNVDLALLEKDSLKASHEALRAVGTEVNILSEILQDLAMLTSSGKNMIYQQSINLKELAEEISGRLKALALDKNISIFINAHKNNEFTLSGDKRYIEKLFLNLIKNAITYGKKNGHIHINLVVDKKSLNIEIMDNGIGISKDDLPNIFERFYRADKSHTGGHSGLGLAIAKWVADVHHGSINVKSTPGKGSTFFVSLPRENVREN